MNLYSELNAGEIERLALLLEEMGEAQQIIGKILRHGYSSYDPTRDNAPHNAQLLEDELGDVQFAIELLCVSGEISRYAIDAAKKRKAERITKYLHHQKNVMRNYRKLNP